MATVQSFRGVLFDTAKVSGLSRVLAPPFDPVDREARKPALEKDTFNVARLLEASPAPSVESWLTEKILQRRPAPAIYPYTQEYSAGGKKKLFRGFFALGKLEPLGGGSVSALEEPHPGSPEPPAATGAEIEPIVMLYSGADSSVEEKLQACEAGAPLFEVTDDMGAVHRVWELTDADAVCRGLDPAKLLLARGQEAYRAELAKNSGGMRMMLFAPFDPAALSARPVHRLVHVPDEFDFNHFFEALGAAFDVYPLYGPDAIQGLLDKAAPGECRIVTFIARPRRCLLMVPKLALPPYGEGHSEAWRKLDTAVLHGVVLSHVVGVAPEKQVDPDWLAYKRGVDVCVTTLQAASRYRIAFLLNPATMDQIQSIAGAGEPLPAHTVEMGPVVPAGLVMRVGE